MEKKRKRDDISLKLLNHFCCQVIRIKCVSDRFSRNYLTLQAKIIFLKYFIHGGKIKTQGNKPIISGQDVVAVKTALQSVLLRSAVYLQFVQRIFRVTT